MKYELKRKVVINVYAEPYQTILKVSVFILNVIGSHQYMLSEGGGHTNIYILKSFLSVERMVWKRTRGAVGGLL